MGERRLNEEVSLVCVEGGKQRRTLVNVIEDYSGFTLHPTALILPSGHTFHISRVMDVKDFPGKGCRYICIVKGKPLYLWNKGREWFYYGEWEYMFL